MQRQILVQKSKEVEEIKSILDKYEVIGIANLNKVRASQLQEIRKKLRGIAHLQVVKNTLVRKAIEEFPEKSEIKNLERYFEGSNLLIFTNINPFSLVLVLEKSRIKDYAKAGDIATEDISVLGGNTGLPPGPVISQLNVVGIPTRIESGSVYVNRDTVVAREGDVISENLAPVLSKLGLKPIEMGLSLKVIYDEGSIIGGEDLHLDLEEYTEKTSSAFTQALSLALDMAYPAVETILILIHRAVSQTYNLAMSAVLLEPEVAPDLVRKAYAEASILETIVQNPTAQ